VLDIPYYSPVMLARRVSTLDVLSGGRARLGLGLGWSKDEHDALGVEMKGRGAKADEFLAVLKAIWTTDPAEFTGKHYTLPRSHILPKPVQKPHPPIVLGAHGPLAVKRVVDYCDGWIPIGVRAGDLRASIAELHAAAREKGRDPRSISISLYGAPGDADALRGLRDLGVSRAIFSVPSKSRDEVLPILDRYAAAMRAAA
jgi:probable F420-dependent oxidoreductase